MKIFLKIASVLILLSLISCGGGGGGGGSSPASFLITLDKTAVNFTMSVGDSGASTIVTATASGSYSGTIYVGAVVEGVGIDSYIPFSASGNAAQFTLHVANGLAIGTYTGRVLIYACSDPYCDHPIGGTPIAVSYSVVVQPPLTVTPNPVNMSAVSGSTATASLSVSLPAGATSFTAVAAGAPTWLQIGSPSSTAVQLVAQSVRSGTYNTSIQVTANTGQSATVPLTYTVGAPTGGEHDLALSPNSLGFAAIEGAVAPVQTLSFSPPTWDPGTAITLTTSYTNGSGWLTVTPTSGGASVEASAAGLTQGTYMATVHVTPQSGTAVSVPVILQVGYGLMGPAEKIINVNSETTASDLQGVATIGAAGGVPAFPWAATSNASWLILTRASGMTGTDLIYQVDQAALQSLANSGSYTATVTISSTGPAYTPLHFTVRLYKYLPETSYVGPYVLVSGRATTVYVRGRGFDALQSVSARLATSGLMASGVTRINDTEIAMQVTPASVGDYSVSIANELGLDAGSAVLHVIAPRTYTYAAVPSGGAKRTIVFDPQRQSVYTVNVGTEALTRFSYSGGTWGIDALPLAGILDAGMGPDGNSLVVTSTPGTVRLLDPVTLSTQFSLGVPEGLARNLTYVSQGISTSNNGRSWLAVGSGGWNEFSYFDHQSRTVMTRPIQPSLSTNFYGGPWTSMARSGERMLITQTGGLSPPPPMLYSDAADSLLHANPASLTASYDMQMSDDGSRILFDQYEVRDANFNLIGRTRIPSSDSAYFGVAGAMSPNGTRAYVLAYRNDALNYLPTTIIMPRVYVFDSSQASPSSSDLALIGSFDLSDYPTCRTSDYNCNLRARTTISPDGNTLFFVGDANLVVVPISASFRTLSVMSAANRPTSAPTTKKVLPMTAPLQPWTIKK